MTPCVQRTWAPRACTPVIRARASRMGISVMGALTLTGRTLSPYVYFKLYPKRAVRGDDVAEFLRGLLRARRGRIIVVLDRARIHRCKPVYTLLERHPRLTVEYLPPYAPDLNPIEWLWGYLKYRCLANFCPATLPELGRKFMRHARKVARRKQLLQSFVNNSQLDLTLPV